MSNGSPVFGGWIALALFVGLLAASEVGYRFGRRTSDEYATIDSLSAIQGAILGLLALLLGFSFAGSSSRFSDRTKLVQDEANAVKLLWLRTDLLPGPQQSSFRETLRSYVDARVSFYDASDETAYAAAIARSEEIQGSLWRSVTAMTKASQELSGTILGPVDSLLELHGKRVVAAQAHLPGLILLVLLLCSSVAMGAVNYGCGVLRRRNTVMTTSLTFLVAAVLWTILDLDHPRQGLIRTGQQPMLDLQKAIRSTEHPWFRKP